MPAAFPTQAALRNAALTAAETGCPVVLTKGDVKVEVLPPQTDLVQRAQKRDNTCDDLFRATSG